MGRRPIPRDISGQKKPACLLLAANIPAGGIFLLLKPSG